MAGYTKEEEYLNSIGLRSFLKFWTYPSLFRDQGDVSKNGDGKEICDLTIIFDNNVIFFSDKKISFSLDKPNSVSWPRWSKKAIRDSIKQIKGARRWFREYPDRIYLDKECNHKVPIEIPRDGNEKFTMLWFVMDWKAF